MALQSSPVRITQICAASGIKKVIAGKVRNARCPSTRRQLRKRDFSGAEAYSAPQQVSMRAVKSCICSSHGIPGAPGRGRKAGPGCRSITADCAKPLNPCWRRLRRQPRYPNTECSSPLVCQIFYFHSTASLTTRNTSTNHTCTLKKTGTHSSTSCMMSLHTMSTRLLCANSSAPGTYNRRRHFEIVL